MNTQDRHRVLVLGGGYAGVLAASRVAGRGRRAVQVTLVEPKEAFVERLRLHQLAAGDASVRPRSYRKLLPRAVEVVHRRAEHIDLARGAVSLAPGADEERELRFDQLVYAVGSRVALGAVPGAAAHAHSLSDPAAAARLATALTRTPAGAMVTVVGTGLTGIELATEIAARHPRLRVRLLGDGPLGAGVGDRGRAHLGEALAHAGIELVDDARVVEVGERRLALHDGRELASELTVWCAGFVASPLAAVSGLATDADGRLRVDRALRAVGHPEVVAAGDAAATSVSPDGAPLRMCCQVAMPTGVHAGSTALDVIRGREPEPFHFGFVHQPISLGRRDGLVQFVDRADHPRARVLTGRIAAFYKERVTAGAVTGMRLERRLPGATLWPWREQVPADAPAVATRELSHG